MSYIANTTKDLKKARFLFDQEMRFLNNCTDTSNFLCLFTNLIY